MTLPELPANRDDLLRQIRDERAALEQTLARVPPDAMTEPLLDGGWSVKDALAHVAAWEGMMVEWVEATLRGETPDRPATGDDWVDQLNAALHAKHKEMLLADVQSLFASSHKRAYAIARRLSEEELFEPDRFAWRQGVPLVVLVAANTCWHYPEHRAQLEKLAA